MKDPEETCPECMRQNKNCRCLSTIAARHRAEVMQARVESWLDDDQVRLSALRDQPTGMQQGTVADDVLEAERNELFG